MRAEAAQGRRATGQETDGRLTVVAYQRLLAMMRSGELPPGGILQERRLAKSLNISRTPLRDALFRLEGEGFVVRHKEGVLQVKPVTLEDYRDALRVRMLLECEAARLAAGRVAGADITVIRARLADLLNALDAGAHEPERAELDEVDDTVHRMIAEASGNPLLADLIGSVRQRSRLFGLERRPARLRATCAEHDAILEALAAGKGATAAKAMAHHLDGIAADLQDRLLHGRSGPGR